MEYIENIDELENNNDLNKQDNNSPVELTELFRHKLKSAALYDILTVQAIICIAAALVFILLNMAFPSAAADAYDEYRTDISAVGSNDPAEIAAENVIEFINSKPVVYD